MTPPQLHVVFGAGQIGAHLARLLVARGHTVRIARRSQAAALDGIPVVSGDAGDAAFATRATEGASVIYHCMNPAYSARVWATELPRIATSLVAAAGHSNARLVVLDNLYMLGRPAGPINEDSPACPVSRKGEIRAQVADLLLGMHRSGAARVVMGRASDFYGPAGTQSNFGDFFWPRVLAGKSAQLLMNPDTAHTYHFTHDVAAGLAALGAAADDDYGQWWMLPCAPADTTRDMVRRLSVALGRDIAVERVPGLVLAAMGLFVPVVREVREMLYSWEVPWVCDDRRFRERFGVAPTPLAEGVNLTTSWARAHYSS
jgi:nucleoside-diphosphate-sugar epimerase